MKAGPMLSVTLNYFYFSRIRRRTAYLCIKKKDVYTRAYNRAHAHGVTLPRICTTIDKLQQPRKRGGGRRQRSVHFLVRLGGSPWPPKLTEVRRPGLHPELGVLNQRRHCISNSWHTIVENTIVPYLPNPPCNQHNRGINSLLFQLSMAPPSLQPPIHERLAVRHKHWEVKED